MKQTKNANENKAELSNEELNAIASEAISQKIVDNASPYLQAYNHYEIKPAKKINPSIAVLPKAEIWNLQAINEDVSKIENVDKYKIVRVTNASGKVKYINPCTSRYTLVQHEKAFRPIIDALTVSGVKDFVFSIQSNHKEATLNIYTGGYGYDGVLLGFSINNSFCGHKTLTYGFEVQHGKQYIEIVGYRKWCANGALMRVPLDKAEIIRPELARKVRTLISEQNKFRHTNGVLDNIERMKYTVEAVSLLAKPVENMIMLAEKYELDKDKFKQLVKLHVGNRYKSKVKDAYDSETNNLWGLYNAITFVASHDKELSDSSRNTLMQKASKMLLVEVTN